MTHNTQDITAKEQTQNKERGQLNDMT